MLMPLLVSSLAIIIAFVPLVAGQTETGEYMRSLGIVLAITLLLSLLLGLTVTRCSPSATSAPTPTMTTTPASSAR
jgi:multidrug efflux pump subunit AcrB